MIGKTASLKAASPVIVAQPEEKINKWMEGSRNGYYNLMSKCALRRSRENAILTAKTKFRKKEASYS